MENKYNEEDIRVFLSYFKSFPNEKSMQIETKDIFPRCQYFLFMKEYDNFLKEIFTALAENSGAYSANNAIMCFLFRTPIEDMPLYINKDAIDVRSIPEIYQPAYKREYLERYIDLYMEITKDLFNKLAKWRLDIGK